ncbi:hypothetical protein [Mumia sp. DW29H23]|uniref:hypothetical protein n=1 Tax=Mumia sp. DW29H23 TaxID=3421241 RepID=UPI003D69DCE9
MSMSGWLLFGLLPLPAMAGFVLGLLVAALDSFPAAVRAIFATLTGILGAACLSAVVAWVLPAHLALSDSASDRYVELFNAGVHATIAYAMVLSVVCIALLGAAGLASATRRAR